MMFCQFDSKVCFEEKMTNFSSSLFDWGTHFNISLLFTISSKIIDKSTY